MTPKQEKLIENYIRTKVRSMLKEDASPDLKQLFTLLTKAADLAESFNHNTNDEWWDSEGDLTSKKVKNQLLMVWRAFGVGNRQDSGFGWNN